MPGVYQHTPETLEAVYAARGLASASQLAECYGISRNAVIGIWHREARRRGDPPIRAVKLEKRRPMQSGRGHHRVAPLPPREGGKDAVFFARSGGCRFPLWTDASEQHLFCDAPTTRGSYCAKHYRICYYTPRKG